jgi:hypothetical protein
MGAGLVEEAAYGLRTTPKHNRMRPSGASVDARASEGR